MHNPEDDDFDYENDESWYEDAMNALDSPANNHDTIYTEEEIAELSDQDKTIIRYRNALLQNGFEHIELKNGDYINDVIGRSGVIHAALCSFVLCYKKDRNYVTIFHLFSKDENIVPPIQLAAVIYVDKHLGSYQFIEFFHLEEELGEDQKDINSITINRDLTYKGKPSLEFYKSDDVALNKTIIERMEKVNPALFEFMNEYLIVELQPNSTIQQYEEVIREFEY